MTDQNKILIEGLEQRLLWYREEASADEFDADEVDAICTMLLKLSPPAEPHRTKEEAYQNIMRLIDLEEENPEEEKPEGKNLEREEAEKADGKKADSEKAAADGSAEESAGGGKRRHFFAGKRALRAAVIVIAAVGIFASLNTVTYARENKSLFTIILERVGWLQIEKEPEVESSVVGNDRVEETFYDSWGDLDREVKEKITVPAYIPEGYSLYGVNYWNREYEIIIRSDYYDQGNGHLSFEITLWEDNADHYKETLMDEDENRLVSEYSDKNTLYYAYDDEYICIAYMEDYFYRISGNISLEEMIKIREGLGDNIR